MYLTGGYVHTMDGNGRLILPAKLREAIGSMFYLCIDLSNEHQLEGLSPEDFELKGEIMSEQYANEPEKVDYFFTYSAAVTVDKQGRMVIPENLRTKTGLGSDIMIVGMLKKFIIKNNAPVETPDKDELREFNRNIARLMKEKREQEKTASRGE